MERDTAGRSKKYLLISYLSLVPALVLFLAFFFLRKQVERQEVENYLIVLYLAVYALYPLTAMICSFCGAVFAIINLLKSGKRFPAVLVLTLSWILVITAILWLQNLLIAGLAMIAFS